MRITSPETRFEVSFKGPAMIRRTRGALAAAAITPLVDRHNSTVALREGASEVHEFVVSLRARDASQAVARTRVAVQAGGAYAGFLATHRSLLGQLTVFPEA